MDYKHSQSVLHSTGFVESAAVVLFLINSKYHILHVCLMSGRIEVI